MTERLSERDGNMNKKELIEHISNTLDERLRNTIYTLPMFSITESAKSNEVSLELKTERVGIVLDRVPQKPVVPQFVADWIEECKDDDFHLFGAMEGISSNQKKLDYWFREDDNMEIFARAWLDGYTVEKEKRYRVRIKGVYYNSCLIFDKINKKWFLSSIYEIDHQMGSHTKKELEQGGFGWVFDCPGVEIEEVEE